MNQACQQRSQHVNIKGDNSFFTSSSNQLPDVPCGALGGVLRQQESPQWRTFDQASDDIILWPKPGVTGGAPTIEPGERSHPPNDGVATVYIDCSGDSHLGSPNLAWRGHEWFDPTNLSQIELDFVSAWPPMSVDASHQTTTDNSVNKETLYSFISKFDSNEQWTQSKALFSPCLLNPPSILCTSLLQFSREACSKSETKDTDSFKTTSATKCKLPHLSTIGLELTLDMNNLIADSTLSSGTIILNTETVCIPWIWIVKVVFSHNENPESFASDFVVPNCLSPKSFAACRYGPHGALEGDIGNQESVTPSSPKFAPDFECNEFSFKAEKSVNLSHALETKECDHGNINTYSPRDKAHNRVKFTGGVKYMQLKTLNLVSGHIRSRKVSVINCDLSIRINCDFKINNIKYTGTTSDCTDVNKRHKLSESTPKGNGATLKKSPKSDEALPLRLPTILFCCSHIKDEIQHARSSEHQSSLQSSRPCLVESGASSETTQCGFSGPLCNLRMLQQTATTYSLPQCERYRPSCCRELGHLYPQRWSGSNVLSYSTPVDQSRTKQTRAHKSKTTDAPCPDHGLFLKPEPDPYLFQNTCHFLPVNLRETYLSILWVFWTIFLHVSNLLQSFSQRLLQSKERSPERRCFLLLILYISLVVFGLPAVKAQGLAGTVPKCDNEGEPVHMPSITDVKCVSCFCRGGLVKCGPRECPSLDGCDFAVADKPTDQCCHICKGCVYKGKQYESGLSWLDGRDSCKQLSCAAAVVTVSEVQCYTPCSKTLPPLAGQCCPRCKGCYFQGRTYVDGDKFQLPTDICTTCRCERGNLVCERQQCPVLNCNSTRIYQSENECCPKCKDSRKVYTPRNACYFARKVFKSEQNFYPSKCTECVCESTSTSVCNLTNCPALDCPEAERVLQTDSGCDCMVCVEKRPCQFAGETYKHREHWRPNVCMSCSCEDGRTYCTRQKCNNSLWCPPGYKLRLSRNHCCPTCIEHDAVCSVFGDPHYRTFDGLTYSFQGTCKYVLAEYCPGKPISNDTKLTGVGSRAGSKRNKGKKRKQKKKKKSKRKDDDYFLIKVRNGVRFSSGFAWTQMLVVLVAGHRVSLLQGGIVKVNRRRIRRMPHSVPGKLTVTRSGGLVKLRTAIGLQVSWDGDSFAEVTVTTRLKHKVCGLCGSYNGVKADDLIGRDGKLYDTGQEMGHTWRVGGTRACKSRPRLVGSEPLCEHDPQARLRAHRVCSVFYGREFSRCRQIVEVDVYVSSCITDMCDCPSGRYCACEAIRAYTSQCARAGVSVKWESLSTFCQITPECSSDSRLVDCAETCPGTCDRTVSDVPCPRKCNAACWCRDRSKVFHKGRCIAPSDCPGRRR